MEWFVEQITDELGLVITAENHLNQQQPVGNQNNCPGDLRFGFSTATNVLVVFEVKTFDFAAKGFYFIHKKHICM